VTSCLREENYFLCHKGTLNGEKIACRGFLDAYGDRIPLIRIARQLNLFEDVNPKDYEPKRTYEKSRRDKGST
jgi:hypothetical protein